MKTAYQYFLEFQAARRTLERARMETLEQMLKHRGLAPTKNLLAEKQALYRANYLRGRLTAALRSEAKDAAFLDPLAELR